MHFTPPASPTESNESDHAVLDTETHGFQCLGEPKEKCAFHPQGPLVNGEALFYISCQAQNNSCLEIFGQLYDFDNASTVNLSRLFQIARNRMCLLESPDNTSGFSTKIVSPKLEVDGVKIRREVQDLFLILRLLVATEGNDPENHWILMEVLPTIHEGLRLFRLQLGQMSDLPSYVLNPTDPETDLSKAHHWFHLHLELKWLEITTLYHLSQTHLAALTYESEYSSQKCCELLNENILLCMSDLIKLAIKKFEVTKPNQLISKSAHSCMCVKELWVLLRITADHLNDITLGKKFYVLIESLLKLVVKEESPMASITCSDPALFSLWFLKHVAELFYFDKRGNLLDQSQMTDGMNYSLLNEILDKVTDISASIAEPQRRFVVACVKVLVIDLWEPKPEPLMTLWNCFSRNLDATFQLPGSSVLQYTVASEHASDILDFVLELIDHPTSEHTNSYDLFLHLIGRYLKRNPGYWKQKMKGRVLSKLSTRKIESLKEMGLFHLIKLFITITLSAQVDDDIPTMQNHLKFDDKATCPRRNVMIMKGHLAFVLLCLRRSVPLSNVLTYITKSVNDFFTRRQLEVAREFIHSLTEIFSADNSFEFDQHLLIGDWIQYCFKQEAMELKQIALQKLLFVLKKLREHNKSGLVGAGMDKLTLSLREHLLPNVKDLMLTSANTADLAEIAAQFTLLGLELPPTPERQTDSFDFLFNNFLSSDCLNVSIARRYLRNIVSEDAALNRICSQSDDKQINLTQVLVRCCALSPDYNSNDLCEIAASVLRTRIVHEMLPTVDIVEAILTSPDILCEFFKQLRKRYPSFPDQNQFRKNCYQFFQPLEKCFSNLHIGSSKTKYDQVTCARLIHVVAQLCLHCGSIIFQKNYAGCLLVKFMGHLVPQSLRSMDVRLSSVIDESIRPSILTFLRGLFKLDPHRESNIKRYFSDVISLYMPRLAVEPPNPFLEVWDDPDHLDAAQAILKIVCEKFLQAEKSKIQGAFRANHYYVQAVRLFRDLLLKHHEEKLLKFIILEAFPLMIDVIAKINEPPSSVSFKETENTLRKIFKNEVYNTHSNLWTLTNQAMDGLSKKHLVFSPDHFSKILKFLLKEHKLIVKRFSPSLKTQVNDAIRKRGMGSNQIYKSVLEIVEQANLK